ncbi:MAG: type II toxin-antitoxin system VapB family antitoxin [Selenomonadaceae bacterium]|nr:type II toxin-antitoxin system VapB family antitoxin [Selenomonadaceae bacterium]MBP3721661.1 type II toxin-antitoxin system VapB family antitoxin [Selenomonadaceae bacterium]
MTANITIDNALLNQAVQVGGLKSQNDTVTLALKEFIERREVKNLIAAFGTVDFDENYDYKAERKKDALDEILRIAKHIPNFDEKKELA